MTPIERRAILELGLAGIAGFLLGACAGDAATGSTLCVAGESVDCALETCFGKAICQPDGSFSQCVCEGGSTGLGGTGTTGTVTGTTVGATGTGATVTGTSTTGTSTTGTGTDTSTSTTGTSTTGTDMGTGTSTSTTGTGTDTSTSTTGTGTTGTGTGSGGTGTGTGTGVGGMGAGGGAGMGGTGAGGVCSTGIEVSDGNGITSMHAHALMIPGADIDAGAPMTYTMSGDHTHTVSLSAAEFEQLRNGQTVNVTSSNDGNHTHAVVLGC